MTAAVVAEAMAAQPGRCQPAGPAIVAGMPDAGQAAAAESTHGPAGPGMEGCLQSVHPVGRGAAGLLWLHGAVAESPAQAALVPAGNLSGDFCCLLNAKRLIAKYSKKGLDPGKIQPFWTN